MCPRSLQWVACQCTELPACGIVIEISCLLLQNSKDLDAAWREIPELKEMRKKSFRKHLRKLATPEEREKAKAERAKQTAHKQQLIADFVAKQKQQKRKFGNAENVIKLISEGERIVSASSQTALQYSCSCHLS